MSSYYTNVSCTEWQMMQDTIHETDAFLVRNREEKQKILTLESERQRELKDLLQDKTRLREQAVDLIVQVGNASLADVRESIQEELTRNNGEMREQIHHLQALAREEKIRLSQMREGIDQISENYNKIVNSILQQEDREKSTQQMINALERLLEQIDRLHPETFAESQYRPILANYQSARISADKGDYQAALLLLQGGVVEAGCLLTKLIVLNEQYDAAFREAYEDYNSLQNKIETYMAKDGVLSAQLGKEMIEVPYDIAFWSNGRFDIIRQEMSGIGDRMNLENRGVMTIDELSDCREKIRRLSRELSMCDENARTMVAGSISTENTAQRIYENLSERGWTLEEGAGHVEDDERKPYAMSFQDIGGNTLAIVIASGNSPEKPEFYYEAFANNEGMGNLIKQSMSETLESVGLQTDRIVHRDDCDDHIGVDSFVRGIESELERKEMI